MPLVEIAVANARARIRTKSTHAREDVDKMLSYFSKVAPYQKSYKLWKKNKVSKNGNRLGWNGVIHLLAKKDESFPAGLAERVARKLDEDYDVKVYDAREKPDPHPKLRNARIRLDLIQQRDWQDEAFEAAKANPRGIFQAATGSGKTTLIARIVAHYGQPTLILVHRNTLAVQTCDRLREIIEFPHADDPFGIVGDGQWEPGLITVATYQTLHSMLESHEKETLAWLDQFKAIHIDESHHVAARTFFALTSASDGAYYRYGYSATPFKEDYETELRLVGVCGEIIYTYTPLQAIEDKITLPPHIYFIDPEYDELPGHDPLDGKYMGTFAKEYKEGIVTHRSRNRLLAIMADACAKHGLPTLVFFRHLEQGKTLLRRIDNSEMVDGSSSLDERTDAKKRLASGDLPVLIASTIFNEGEDVPAVGAVIIGGGYKAEHLILQEIGRGSRPTKGQRFFLVLDIYDSHSERLERHSKKRMKACRDAGFETHMVTVDKLETLMKSEEFFR